MLDRREILNQAYHNCMREMFAKAQPEADWDNLIEELRAGKIKPDEAIYNRHFLSMDEFLYIRDKYKEAYNIKSHWKSDIEILEEYLTKGGLKDKYIPDHTDEDGFNHPGYRSSEEVPPLKEHILKLMYKWMSNSSETQCEGAAKEITEKVMELIKNCKDFYQFDREESDFDCNISLGCSPCTNAETVKDWWKENYNHDVEIEERNPKLFWYRDNDYTDEDLEYEFDSPNWKEIVDKEWEEEKEAEKHKHEEALKALEEEYAKFKEKNNQ